MDLLHREVAHHVPGGAGGSTWFFEHQLAPFAKALGSCYRLQLKILYDLLILISKLLHLIMADKNMAGKVPTMSFPLCRTRKTKRPSLIKSLPKHPK